MTEQEIKTKRLEILEDTVKYYSEDVSRRASTTEGCEYKTKDGRMCAIGRLTKNKKIYECAGDVSVIEHLLEEELIILGFPFLNHLQLLHDKQLFWESNGLTKEGKEKYDNIKLNFCV